MTRGDDMVELVPELATDAHDSARGLERTIEHIRAERSAGGAHPSERGTGLRARPDGLVEVDVDDLAPEHLRTALADPGVLVVRGFLDAAGVADLRRAALDGCRAVDGLVGRARDGEAPATVPFQAGGPLAEHFAGLRPINRICLGAMVADWPAGFAPLLAGLARSSVVDTIAAHLGEKPSLAVEKSVVRHVPAELPALAGDGASLFPDHIRGWHQDGLPWERPADAVNVWVTAERCGGGTERRGIELIPRSGGRRLPRFAQMGSAGYAETIAALREANEPVHPDLEPGDAVMFDGTFVHRTPPQPGFTASRTSAELWFFAPSSFPSRLHPLTFATGDRAGAGAGPGLA